MRSCAFHTPPSSPAASSAPPASVDGEGKLCLNLGGTWEAGLDNSTLPVNVSRGQRFNLYPWAGGIFLTAQISFVSVCVCVWSDLYGMIANPLVEEWDSFCLRDDEQWVFIIKFIVIVAIDYYYNSLPGISVNICSYAGKIKETLENAYWNHCLLSQPFLGLLRTYYETWWMTDELKKKTKEMFVSFLRHLIMCLLIQCRTFYNCIVPYNIETKNNHKLFNKTILIFK